MLTNILFVINIKCNELIIQIEGLQIKNTHLKVQG